MREMIEADPAVEEVRAEQLARWQAGDRARLEDLLAARPGLSDDPEATLDLLYAEVLLREEYGESPGPEEYLRRFPHLEGPLRRLFQVHEALASLGSAATPRPGDGTVTRDEPGPGACPAPGAGGVLGPAGSYEVLEEIGRGGMGIVYKARHLVTGRTAALKVMRAGEATEQERARFLTEAKAVAALHHPNIVQIYEVFAPPPGQGTPFVALEYVGGGNLTSRIGGTPLSPREAASLLLPLAEAVSHAHQAGIVHRDLKPANVLLQEGLPAKAPRTPRPEEKRIEDLVEDREDGGRSAPPPLDPPSSTLDPRPSSGLGALGALAVSSLVPKVTDFGLAKQLDAGSGQTRTGDVLGTPSYMAPEQAGGQTSTVGPAADVYSLGAILYEMLTGRPPFKGATVLDTLAQVQLQEPVAPGRLNPVVPRDLETICLKCLRKEPARRYPSGRELADDLARYLGGEPIRARPVGRTERAFKWVKRRPAAAALLGVVGLAVTALVGVWVSFTVRLEARRQEALAERDRAGEQARIARRQTEEARRQSERAAHLLALTAAAVDDIAVSARGPDNAGARYRGAGSVLFKLASFYARASTVLAGDRVLPAEDRRRLAEQYAASAVRLLKCAERAGWFDPPGRANRAALDGDPAFATLRNRADYRRFREGLR